MAAQREVRAVGTFAKSVGIGIAIFAVFFLGEIAVEVLSHLHPIGDTLPVKVLKFVLSWAGVGYAVSYILYSTFQDMKRWLELGD